MRKSLLAIPMLALSTLCWSESPSYLAGPTWGTVADADSKEPIAGALVLALWNVEGGAHWDVVGTFKILEAETDSQGRFQMPGWGPAKPTSGVLDSYDPQVIIVKAGYNIESVTHPLEPPLRRASNPNHDFVSNGETISLRKYQGTPQAYAMNIGSYLVGGVLGDVLYKGCMWKEIPMTVRYLESEAKREREAGLRLIRSVSVDRLLARKECAPTEEFMKKYNEAR
jgi:hypothetical protein